MNNKTMRVVKIIDDRSIVINAGENEGIKEGDRFCVYSENGTPVIDPVTKEDLGAFRGIKAKIEATIVYEKMSICENTIKIGGIANNLSELAFEPFLARRASLNVDPAQISGGLDISVDEPIRIGDNVEKIK